MKVQSLEVRPASGIRSVVAMRTLAHKLMKGDPLSITKII